MITITPEKFRELVHLLDEIGKLLDDTIKENLDNTLNAKAKEENK